MGNYGKNDLSKHVLFDFVLIIYINFYSLTLNTKGSHNLSAFTTVAINKSHLHHFGIRSLIE